MVLVFHVVVSVRAPPGGIIKLQVAAGHPSFSVVAARAVPPSPLPAQHRTTTTTNTTGQNEVLVRRRNCRRHRGGDQRPPQCLGYVDRS